MIDELRSAIVIGAGGGIGNALAAALAEAGTYDVIHALSRRSPADGAPGIRHALIDVTTSPRSCPPLPTSGLR